MSDLVGNPKDWFSRVEAQIVLSWDKSCSHMCLCIYFYKKQVFSASHNKLHHEKACFQGF